MGKRKRLGESCHDRLWIQKHRWWLVLLSQHQLINMSVRGAIKKRIFQLCWLRSAVKAFLFDLTEIITRRMEIKIESHKKSNNFPLFNSKQQCSVNYLNHAHDVTSAEIRKQKKLRLSLKLIFSSHSLSILLDIAQSHLLFSVRDYCLIMNLFDAHNDFFLTKSEMKMKTCYCENENDM